MLDAAIKYADLGFAVFPCAPGAKRPANENGLTGATTDVEQIEAWWDRWPEANVAIRTDGLVVLDLDPIDGRPNPWISDQPERYIDLAVAPLSQTPRGGRHYFFRQPVGRPIKCSQSKIAPKVDVRAEGGYVLVSPSVVNGKPYSWPLGELDCAPHKLPEPPGWLLDLLDPPTKLESVRAEVAAPSNKIPSGQRNGALTSLGGAMRHYGMSQAEIAAALRRVNLDRCTPPLDDAEVDKIAWSVGRYEPDQSATAVVELHYAQDFGDDEVEAESVTDDPGPIPPKLLNVPGFIGDVMAYSLETAPYPNAVLAFGGALALQAFLASRKVKEVGGSRSNLYLLGLANSGVGKEHPRQVTQRILTEVGLGDCVANKLASFEGLEDLLYVKPAMLLQIDEVDGLLQAVRSSKESRHDLIVKALTEIFTAAAAVYPLRAKAGQEAPRFIHQPGLSIYGTAIPSRVYESMDPKLLVDGFFSRLLILEAGKRGDGQEPIAKAMPETIVRTARWWAEFTPGTKPGNLAAFNPDPKVIGHTPDAAELLTAFRKAADVNYQEAESRDDQVGMALWSRANEKSRRLCVNWACSKNHVEPIISADAAEWATAFITHQTRRMLFMAASHVTENDFEARGQKLLRLLRKWREQNAGAFMPDRAIKRKLRGWTTREHDEIRLALLAQGRIEQASLSHEGAGRPSAGLRLKSGH